MLHRARSTLVAPLVSLALLSASPAQASGLQVAPVSITLAATEASDGLTLSNVGDRPLHAQVRVYRWRQDENGETLEPTRDIVVSPPMIALAPGSDQLVRVIRAGPAPLPGAVEDAYRIVVDELPVATAGSDAGLNFVLRYSLPVFVMPPGPAPRPELSWHIAEQDGAVAIKVANAGAMHAQVADVALVGSDGTRTVLAPGLLGYALPGSSRSWATAVPWSAAAGESTLEVRINGQEARADLPLAGPSR